VTPCNIVGTRETNSGSSLTRTFVIVSSESTSCSGIAGRRLCFIALNNLPGIVRLQDEFDDTRPLGVVDGRELVKPAELGAVFLGAGHDVGHFDGGYDGKVGRLRSEGYRERDESKKFVDSGSKVIRRIISNREGS
jgi:hypothetical protein